MIERVFIHGEEYKVVDNIPIEKAREIFEQQVNKTEDSVITVSYTHLDVYKRQWKKRFLKRKASLRKTSNRMGRNCLLYTSSTG